MNYTLAGPADDEDWRVFHDIRRKVLFEGRHRDVVYDDKHPDDRATHNHPLLLRLDGAPLGTVRLDDFGDGTGCVRLVAITAAEQGRGHGRALSTLVEELARSLGIHTLYVNAAPEAVGFYEKTGWTRHEWSAAELAGIAEGCVQMRKAI
jgi:N-acetylglutamate synthase-like GNAT family acetyltransferase